MDKSRARSLQTFHHTHGTNDAIDNDGAMECLLSVKTDTQCPAWMIMRIIFLPL